MINFTSHTVFVFLTVFALFLYTEFPKYQAFNDDNLHVYFLDVGQGDASLIKTPDKDLILIDTGPGSAVNFELSKILPFWINNIDLLVLTHSHADHIGGVPDLVESYNVECVLYESVDKPISNLEIEVRNDLSEIQEFISACLHDSGSIEFQNYSLRGSSISDESTNENFESIISYIKYGDIDILFAADAELDVQKSLQEQLPKQVDILKVPHHGAEDSLNPNYLQDLGLQLAIISVGENNRFKHPDSEVIDFYMKQGVRVLTTMETGTIHFRSNGKEWFVQ